MASTSHSRSSGLALFLLCCSGVLLSSHSRPLPRDAQSAIITELQFSFSKLMEEYKGVPKSCVCPMQCFSVSPQPPHNVNSSAILPYFRAIEPFFNDKNNFPDVMDHLKKLELQRAPDISVPTDNFQRKMFIKCVLEMFSKCLKLHKGSVSCGAQA
uniref:Interleukin-31 n=1 Tax=Moschus moschiferus TaxID=68415 RepID=A0A8C6CVM4_MOSMO